MYRIWGRSDKVWHSMSQALVDLEISSESLQIVGGSAWLCCPGEPDRFCETWATATRTQRSRMPGGASETRAFV